MNPPTRSVPAAAVVIALSTALLTAPAWSQPKLSGSEEIRLALERLNVTGSVLMIGAHPDDENTALLAMFARGLKLRTGYLSLTRGEGGQNVIGPEQGRLLGQIRTEELLAARRIDGAEQFFSRAVDFGFSKTAEETLTKWDRKAVLGDIVYVIRKFRPDVIVLRFSGTPRDGHGQHQASAILGTEAFSLSADPSAYPEQLKEVQPWQAKRLLWNVFAFTREQEQEAAKLPGRFSVDTGAYDPVLGYSYNEIAGMSRSQHRSQAMGTAERRGSSKQYLTVIGGAPVSSDMFDGISTGWDRVPGAESVGVSLLEAASGFQAREPSKTVRPLLKARAVLAGLTDPISRRKLVELDEAVALCSGIWLDASANTPTAAPGTTVTIALPVINRSPVSAKLQSVRIEGPGDPPTLEGNRVLENNQLLTQQANWTVVPVERHWPVEQPEPDPVLRARFRLDVDGVNIELVRPVMHRYVDNIRGELTRSFVVVPPVSLRIPEGTLLFAGAAPRDVIVEVKAYKPEVAGEVSLKLDGAGWKVEPAAQKFRVEKSGEQVSLSFRVTPPSTSSVVQATARAAVDGMEVAASLVTLRYSHIPQTIVFEQASSRLVRADARVLAKTVGYIVGAGDDVPEALAQLGCQVTLISPEDLPHADFSRFDAIVTGVRAYNVREDLRANEQRLLDYVSAGGTLVVQYNVLQGGAVGNDPTKLERLGPYPLRLGRGRVTVEEAPVEFLQPASILLTTPNKITPADFEGWVQERGLYFPAEWDPRYQTVIASGDPGEKPLPGGTLYLRYGKGAYIYTAYSWFRQLPAGVPGALRIFANMLSAGKAE